MRSALKLSVLFTFVMLLGSCSKDDDDQNVDAPPAATGQVINYQGTPNAENQLLTEIFVDNNMTTTYMYGTTDSKGQPDFFQSLAFEHANSDTIDFIILDEEQRPHYLYREVNGEKLSEYITFSYPEDGIVNYMHFSRDWATAQDSLIYFTTVETDGDQATAFTLYGKSNEACSIVLGGIVIAAVALAPIGVYAAGIYLGVSQTAAVIGGVTTALTIVGAANANEPLVMEPNPEAPVAPVGIVVENQCDDSSLEVFVGVDPDNLLVAIVNGDSEFYHFYWSTGETGIAAISDAITAPGPGNYYLLVEDENGCFAFATATIQEPGSEGDVIQLLTGGSEKWWYGNTGGFNDGQYESLRFNSDGTGIGRVHDPNPMFTYDSFYFDWEYENGILYTNNMTHFGNINNGEYIGDCATPIVLVNSDFMEAMASDEGDCSYYVRGDYVTDPSGF